jgi:hypothetical protein
LVVFDLRVFVGFVWFYINNNIQKLKRVCLSFDVWFIVETSPCGQCYAYLTVASFCSFSLLFPSIFAAEPHETKWYVSRRSTRSMGGWFCFVWF